MSNVKPTYISGTNGTPKPVDTANDSIAAKAVYVQTSSTPDTVVGISRDASNNLVLSDAVSGSKTLAQLLAGGGGGSGTVTSIDVSGGSTGLTTSGGPVTSSGTITLAGTVNVGHGGTGLTATPTNGQLLIGNGTGYTLASLTAGSNITITPGAGSISIDSTGGSSGSSFSSSIDDPTTSFLLHGTGSNGSTTFTGTGYYRPTITAYGNASVSTTQSKFGGGSIYFDGTGDYLVAAPSDSAFAFGTGNFTIEFWAYITSFANNVAFVDTRSTAAGLGVWVGCDTSGKLWVYGNSNTRILSSSSLPLNTWTHIALTRSSGSIYAFANGVLFGSGTWTDNLTNNYCTIGSVIDYRDTGTTFKMKGYLNEIRVSNGLARYTSAFTPPAAAFADGYLPQYLPSTPTAGQLGSSSSNLYVCTDATGPVWKAIAYNGVGVGGAGVGTVTSIAISGGTTGLTTSGGPVTTSGTITLAGTLAIVNGGTGTTTAPSDGKLLIGKTDGSYSVANLTAGSNITITNGNGTVTIASTGGGSSSSVILQVALSDLTTSITTGTSKAYMRAPSGFTISSVRASLLTASSSGPVTVDINKNGVSILSTKLTIDATQKTSLTAATAAVISSSGVSNDDELTFDITTAGTGAKGLIVTLIGA